MSSSQRQALLQAERGRTSLALMQQQLARANEAMARSARRLQATRNTPYQLMASWGKEAAPFASALPNGAQSGGADHQGRTSEPLI